MKMSFHLHARNGRIKGKKILAPTAITIVIVVFIFLLRGPVSLILHPVLSPIWRFEFYFLGSFENTFEILKSKKSLVEENIELKHKGVLYDETSRALNDASVKNDKLLLMVGRNESRKTTAAVVLRRPPYTFYDSLLIDAGARDGVKVGDYVFSDGATFVGDINEVREGDSSVSLFSTPGRETEVLVGESLVPAKATGKGGGNFIVMLPAEVGVVVGDEVKIPSFKSSILGVVEYIDVDSADSIQTIYFKNIFNVNDLQFVEVYQTK